MTLSLVSLFIGEYVFFHPLLLFIPYLSIHSFYISIYLTYKVYSVPSWAVPGPFQEQTNPYAEW